VIYPQKGRQPDQNPGFYTTGLVLANQHRNLDALNLKIALDHAAAGIRVFPVSVIQRPDGRWKKRPAIKGWKDVATTDPDQIRRWWQEFPEAVPGTELGRAGLVVIDADRHDPNCVSGPLWPQPPRLTNDRGLDCNCHLDVGHCRLLGNARTRSVITVICDRNGFRGSERSTCWQCRQPGQGRAVGFPSSVRATLPPSEQTSKVQLLA
jgi:hypothetical protein